jgi:hypothetical protein
MRCRSGFGWTSGAPASPPSLQPGPRSPWSALSRMRARVSIRAGAMPLPTSARTWARSASASSTACGVSKRNDWPVRQHIPALAITPQLSRDRPLAQLGKFVPLFRFHVRLQVSGSQLSERDVRGPRSTQLPVLSKRNPLSTTMTVLPSWPITPRGGMPRVRVATTRVPITASEKPRFCS